MEKTDAGLSGLCIREITFYHTTLSIKDKATGADELVPIFLSKIKHQLARLITMLFNNIRKSGQVPADWEEANVVPGCVQLRRLLHAACAGASFAWRPWQANALNAPPAYM